MKLKPQGDTQKKIETYLQGKQDAKIKALLDKATYPPHKKS